MLRHTKNGPLGMCMIGDCDSDDHCENGLVCHQRRTGHTHVPGCAGMGEFGFSYCIRAPLSDSGPAAHAQELIDLLICVRGVTVIPRNIVQRDLNVSSVTSSIPSLIVMAKEHTIQYVYDYLLHSSCTS
mmetsp:Transcript_6379/g.9341  ORF Transcript_6379/g.9341 Transcript_6379/m.9341 type:complete len:129 (+) Transcript_6379:194-580(+)